MAISYFVDSAGTSFIVGYRATGPILLIYTYTQRRGFLPFDLSGAGLSAGSVQSAELILQCVAVTGGGFLARVRSAKDPNGFGATLDATHDDWASTATNDEGTFLITSTGTYTIPVNKNNINFAGVTYYRLTNTNEGAPATYSANATFNSTTASSSKPILRLTLFSGQVISIQLT